MAPRDHGWHVRRAQLVLRELGIELAGTEITLLVVRLLHGLDAGLDDAANVAAAAREVSDGPIGLLAGEPTLGRWELPEPVRTAGDAAEQALGLFARRVLDRQRRDPVVPPDPPTEREMAEMRARMAQRRRRIDAHDGPRIAVEIARLGSPRWSERANAASYLGRFAVGEARAALTALLDDPYPEVAEAAAGALRALPATGSAAEDPAVGPAVELPDFGAAYRAMDRQDAMTYVHEHFDAVSIDLETWETRYRDPADGSLWVVDYPDAQRVGGGMPRVRRVEG
jgi:hypothetical protein